MNTKSYVVAGAASILFHGFLLSVIPSKHVMAVPMGTESPNISLNLVAMTPVAKTIQKPVAPPPVKAPAKTPEPVKKSPPVKSEMKKLVKKTQPEKKQPVKKITKTVKPQPPKPVKKEFKAKPPVTPPKKEVPTEPTPQTKKIEKETKNEVETTNNKATPVTSSGVNTPQLVSKPTFATRPSPVKYPRLAKRRGIEGLVMVEVWIDTKGQQVKQNIINSSGANVLDDAAITAIKKWRFSPHVVNGLAIAHRVQIPIRFKLD